MRGGHRGQCWGDILSDCSYSCAGSGCDGGRVRGVFGLGRHLNNSNTCLGFRVPLSIGRTNIMFLLSSGVFPKFVNRRNGG